MFLNWGNSNKFQEDNKEKTLRMELSYALIVTIKGENG